MGCCMRCGGTGWAAKDDLHRGRVTGFCAFCHGSGTDVPSIREYNKLIPPSNPDYPWRGEDWQPLCYYCCQPIKLTKPWAGVRQRVIYGWEHANPAVSENKYINGSRWHCDPAKVRANIERHAVYKPTKADFESDKEFTPQTLNQPRCHICGTQTMHHSNVCSAAGKPPYHATSLSQKEDELAWLFGWGPFDVKPEPGPSRELRVKVGTVIAALALIALAWATGKLAKDEDDS